MTKSERLDNELEKIRKNYSKEKKEELEKKYLEEMAKLKKMAWHYECQVRTLQFLRFGIKY